MEVKNYIDPEKMLKDVSIQDVNLNAAFIEQSSLFSFYATRHSMAERQEALLKHKLEVCEAKLSRKFRHEARIAKIKVTEGEITSMIRANSLFDQISRAYIDAQQVTNVCKSAVEAFKHRRDMLVQLGADAREDRKGSMRVQASQASQSSVVEKGRQALAGYQGRN